MQKSTIVSCTCQIWLARLLLLLTVGVHVYNIIVANFMKTKSRTLLQDNNHTHDHTHLIASYLIKRTVLVEISVTPTKQTTPS